MGWPYVAAAATCCTAVFCLQVCRFFYEQCTASSGIHMHMSSNPTEIIKEADGKLTVKVEPASKDKSGDSSSSSSSSTEIRGNDTVVLAVGRAGKTKGLGLEEIGVEMGPKGSIKVDDYSRTNIQNIWAVGDVTSRIALTPVAIMEGQAVGDSIATGQLVAPEYDAVPSACFSWPFVATVVSGLPGRFRACLLH
jgi:glutathione reductase (NADPH)